MSAGNANPHNELPCLECHPQTPQAGIPLKEQTGPVSLEEANACLKCHAQNSNLHPLGVKPPKSSPLLPLNSQGEITCLTCHFIHAQTDEYSLLRGFADGGFKSLKDLCFQCHGLEFYRKNPHRAPKPEERCSFCHLSAPKEKASAQVRRFCSFCHSKQVHLTLGGSSSKACPECHVSHGAEDTVYYLKKDFVLAQPPETDPHKDDKSCITCHKNRPADGQPVDFLYGGNITVLCTSCHWSQNFMHAVEVTIPQRILMPKNLPLSAENKITCNTCHDSCTKHQVKEPGFLRLSPEHKSRNDLCFECHPRGKYAKINPHQEQHNREKCLYCHDHNIRLSYRASNPKNTLKTAEHMLCLRCHLMRDTPGFSAHTLHRDVTPVRLVVPAGFKLDKQGRITCSTCHNPHFWEGNKTSLRGELSRDKFCRNCHPDL